MNLYQALKKANIVCYKVQEFCNNQAKKSKGAFLGRIYFLGFAPYISTSDITFKYHFPLEKAQTFIHISIRNAFQTLDVMKNIVCQLQDHMHHCICKYLKPRIVYLHLKKKHIA